MPLMNLIPEGQTPGRRTRLLAESMGNAKASFMNGTLTGPELSLYTKLTSMQCWDAALYCAWSAKGVNCPDVNMNNISFNVTSINNYNRIFGANPRTRSVDTLHDLMTLPEGCFIGFLSNTGVMRHVMIHTSNGHGAGNKSDCILTDGNTAGWELLDMAHFFVKDRNHNGNSHTTMVYMPVTGQLI